ncbi:MAG: hypothetical protein JKY69_07715, partial [Flavobacteriaceae bacterium]|nr:hypothetical protein [Flavobacteriaceae bacterium]
IDLKKYAELRYDSPLITNKSRLPRGAVVVRTVRAPRNGMETKFEWEE